MWNHVIAQLTLDLISTQVLVITTKGLHQCNWLQTGALRSEPGTTCLSRPASTPCAEQRDGGAVEGGRRKFKCRQRRLSGLQQSLWGTGCVSLLHLAPKRVDKSRFRCVFEVFRRFTRATCARRDTWLNQCGSSGTAEGNDQTQLIDQPRLG